MSRVSEKIPLTHSWKKYAYICFYTRKIFLKKKTKTFKCAYPE